MSEPLRYARWNPIYFEPKHFAGSYLSRMSEVDPLPAKMCWKVRLDIGFGVPAGFPLRWDQFLFRFADGGHSYQPTFHANFPPGINTLADFDWVASDEDSGPLTYACVWRMQNFANISYTGSIIEFQQEENEEPDTKPWRRTQTMSIAPTALPDRLSFYDMVPEAFNCWPIPESGD